MKQTPIPFSSLEVVATLDGAKMHTRQVIAPQPEHIEWFEHQKEWNARIRPGYYDLMPCPYGRAGDQLWVREAWGTIFPEDVLKKDSSAVNYMATDPYFFRTFRANSARSMPHWASRITLEIISVKVQRLQDISPGDAIRELWGSFNALSNDMTWRGRSQEAYLGNPQAMAIDEFRNFWNSIPANRDFDWDTNPWVWVIHFKRIIQ